MNYFKLTSAIIVSVSALTMGTISSDTAAASELGSAASAHAVTVSKQARFKVEGMTCASCNVTVKIAAERVQGVVKAGANREKKSAWAVYDPSKTNPKEIAAAITKAGYPATPVQ